MEHPEPRELYKIVLDFFGKKASDPTLRSSSGQVACLLYESFPLRCNFDEHGGFHASIVVSEVAGTTRFFGQRVPMNPDIPSVLSGLSMIDNWCRMRLPDKFLESFDAMEWQEW